MHLPAYNTNDTLIRSRYGSPLLDKVGSPYERRPERDSWKESEVRETTGGVRYYATREVARWAGSHATGDWKVEEVLP